MMKDRDQKSMALQFSVARRWFPQLEVDIEPGKGISKTNTYVTDVDVLSSIPDEFKGFRRVAFDCKTKAKESPINRALWLSGLLTRIEADQGFCILKKTSLEPDHCLMADRLNIVLLSESDFELYSSATGGDLGESISHAATIDLWDRYLSISGKYQMLQPACRFLNSTFWTFDDAAEACRRCITILRKTAPELDPNKEEHVALFFNFCALFGLSLSIVICRLFKVYLHPSSSAALSDALLAMLYGGRSAYKYRSDVFRALNSHADEGTKSELVLPEWERLMQLVRQLLDAPFAVQNTPLLLREVGFSLLTPGGINQDFAKVLSKESPHAVRFSLMMSDYLSKAAQLPREFSDIADKQLLGLIQAK